MYLRAPQQVTCLSLPILREVLRLTEDIVPSRRQFRKHEDQSKVKIWISTEIDYQSNRRANRDDYKSIAHKNLKTNKQGKRQLPVQSHLPSQQLPIIKKNQMCTKFMIPSLAQMLMNQLVSPSSLRVSSFFLHRSRLILDLFRANWLFRNKRNTLILK